MMLAAMFLAACAEELPPPSVQELLDDAILLEATVVRCASNRAESRYEPECINARQAVMIIEAREERARREALELESERKRAALRRAQEEAAEARRRAEEAERLQQEAEYHAQFGEAPPPDAGEVSEDPEPNAPTAVLPADPAGEDAPAPLIGDSVPASDGGNAPAAEVESGQSDLEAVREELRRRAAGEEP